MLQDVEQLSMSTLSFQDYVRERMLKRRQAELAPATAPAGLPAATALVEPVRAAPVLHEPAPAAKRAPLPPTPREAIRFDPTPSLAQASDSAEGLRREQLMLSELRQVKGLIEERFGALAFMEKLQRSPQRAGLTQKLLDAGFSPALSRKLVEGLPVACADENAWATQRARAQPAGRRKRPGARRHGRRLCPDRRHRRRQDHQHGQDRGGVRDPAWRRRTWA